MRMLLNMGPHPPLILAAPQFPKGAAAGLCSIRPAPACSPVPACRARAARLCLPPLASLYLQVLGGAQPVRVGAGSAVRVMSGVGVRVRVRVTAQQHAYMAQSAPKEARSLTSGAH